MSGQVELSGLPHGPALLTPPPHLRALLAAQVRELGSGAFGAQLMCDNTTGELMAIKYIPLRDVSLLLGCQCGLPTLVLSVSCLLALLLCIMLPLHVPK